MSSSPAQPLRELGSDEVEGYRRDGCLMARGLMADEWFEQIERAVAKVMAAPTPISAVFSDPKAGFHMEAPEGVAEELNPSATATSFGSHGSTA